MKKPKKDTNNHWLPVYLRSYNFQCNLIKDLEEKMKFIENTGASVSKTSKKYIKTLEKQKSLTADIIVKNLFIEKTSEDDN